MEKKPASHTGRVSFYPDGGRAVNIVKHLFSKTVFYFFDDRRGATAIEYSLIAAAIAVAISVVVFAFGDQLQGLIESLASMLTSGPS